MGLGPGKGCMVGSPDKETRMDGTPVKARHPIAPEISRLVAEHRPGGPLERDFYVASEVFSADLDEKAFLQGLKDAAPNNLK